MKKLIVSMVSLFCIFSCADLKEAQENIVDLQGRVDAIEQQLSALQAAYDDGKIIKEVKPYSDENHTGWVIIFSDDTSIVLYDGVDGLNGADGKDGEDGKDGVDGKDGEDGKDGVDGKDGEDGKDGVDGKDGIAGIDGINGVTPILRINAQGFWEVSYDNGVTYELVIGADGQPVSSTGAKGDQGDQGEQGAEAISLRVVIGEGGMYVIERYYESNPDVVIESIETPYSSSPELCISSIVMDSVSEIITLVMADGTEYKFNLDVQYPTGIVVLAQTVTLAKGGTSSFMFRVNPSNAFVNLDVTAENPMFELDMALEQMTRSYVTASTNYELESIECALDAQGNVKQGQYKATIKDLDASDYYSEGATLVLNTRDGKGEAIQISSDIFKIRTADKPMFTRFSINDSQADNLENDLISVRLPYGTDVTALPVDFEVTEGTVSVNGVQIQPMDEVNFSYPVKFVVKDLCNCEHTYTVTISYSDIPVVYVNTKNAAPITSKVTWLEDTEIYVTNAGENTTLYTKAQIRGRGNTTWGHPKKPYAIKLDKKANVLGMPKHKRWVLLSNYIDRSSLRNSISFEIAKRSPGLAWTPRGQHVDLVLNGEFKGTYFLCEQIKGDENRVNITEMESTDTDPESITGGYLLELDKNYDEVNKFKSPFKVEEIAPFPLPYMIKEPDEETLVPEQFNWIYNHIDTVERALWGEGSTTEGYLQYIDLDSFIDYWLVYELTGAGEPTHPKSVYMWKERGQKIHAGPVWDFDYYTFKMSYKEMLINTNAVWNERIINDPANRPRIKERWMAQREQYRTIPEEIDRQYALIRESVQYNDVIWPIDPQLDNWGNREISLSVDEIVASMKDYYQIKFNYMDAYIQAW